MLIYRIHNVQTGRSYVGRTKSPKPRMWMHFGQLKRKKHASTRMQQDYDLYGRDSFQVEFLESVHPAANSREREAAWMAHFKCREEGYNQLPPTTKVTTQDGGNAALANNLPPPGSIAELIRRRREVLGISQLTVAEALGFSTGEAISMVETGRRGLDLHLMPALAAVLELQEIEVFKVALLEKCPTLLKHLQPSPAEKSRENAPEREQR